MGHQLIALASGRKHTNLNLVTVELTTQLKPNNWKVDITSQTMVSV